LTQNSPGVQNLIVLPSHHQFLLLQLEFLLAPHHFFIALHRPGAAPLFYQPFED
jgi:hypothetical protein